MQRAFDGRELERWGPIALVLLSIPVLFYGLGSYSVVNGDEAFYHYVSRHMLESRDPFRLEFTGEPRVYDTMLNAPLRYWTGALSIFVLGDGYWSMRIGTALAALLSILMTHRLVGHLAGPRAAFVAGALQLTTYHFVWVHSARTGELEPAIAFLLTLSAYLFLRAHETGRSFVPHHVVIALVMNLKLPIAALPLVAELAWFALSPAARTRLGDWLRALLVLPLGLVWHLGQLAALGEPAFQVLLKMTGQAAGSDDELGLARSGIWNHARFYARTTLLGAFPQALLYPFAVAGLLTAKLEPAQRGAVRLLLLYTAAVYGFFLVVGKALPWYIDPVYPLLSAVLAIWLARLADGSSFGWVAAALAVVAAGLVAIQVAPGHPVTQRAASPLRDAIAWREVAGLAGPWVALAVTAGVGAGAAGLRARWGPALARPVVLGLTGVVLVAGAIRVLAPLPDIAHTSVMEGLRRDLDARRAAGEALGFPIPVREGGHFAVRYFFGDTFEIARARDPNDPAVRFLLLGEGRTATEPPPLRRLRAGRSRSGTPDTR